MLNHAALDHAWIAAHIPHQGSMCLLDRVEAWDKQRVLCRAVSHRALDNPLRAAGQLAAVCGIEYAAQAMAVHGALLAAADSRRARVGFLLSVRSTQLQVARLDDIKDDLQIEAVCISRSAHNVLYEFRLSAADRLLLNGRAAVVLDADVLTTDAGDRS